MKVVAGILLALATIGTLITLAGLAAPLYPPADVFNHLRPCTLAGALALLALVGLAGARRLLIACGALATLNAGLLVLPLLFAASPAAGHARGEIVKVITFNVWTWNPSLADAAAWLVREDADIIVLQEMSAPSRALLVPLLSTRWPHIYDCGCNDLLIASKRRWLAAGRAIRARGRCR